MSNTVSFILGMAFGSIVFGMFVIIRMVQLVKKENAKKLKRHNQGRKLSGSRKVKK